MYWPSYNNTPPPPLNLYNIENTQISLYIHIWLRELVFDKPKSLSLVKKYEFLDNTQKHVLHQVIPHFKGHDKHKTNCAVFMYLIKPYPKWRQSKITNFLSFTHHLTWCKITFNGLQESATLASTFSTTRSISYGF